LEACSLLSGRSFGNGIAPGFYATGGKRERPIFVSLVHAAHRRFPNIQRSGWAFDEM